MKGKNRKKLTPNERNKIQQDAAAGMSIMDIMAKYHRGFPAIKALVNAVPAANDNDRKIRVANQALAKANGKREPLAKLLGQLRQKIKISSPNAARLILDVTTGEAELEEIVRHKVKVAS